jgi:Tol biopolymer transport system component
MKNKRLILALWGLAFFLALVVVVQSQQSKENKAQFETILIGKGGSPKWSQDGTKIAFISEDGWLTIADADGKGEIRKIVESNFGDFDWLDSTTFLVYKKEFIRDEKEKQNIRILTVKSLTLDGKEDLIIEDKNIGPPNFRGPIFFKDGTVGYYEGRWELLGKDKQFKLIKRGNLSLKQAQGELEATTPEGYVGSGPIWLQSIDGSFKKRITKGETVYRFPQLSPDGIKIAAIIMRGDIIVLDINGDELANLGRGSIFKRGPRGCWSPDSKKIAYELTKENEYNVIASELYVVNWDGTDKQQITNTSDEIEMDPQWSPEGSRILCWSYNTGNIFVIKLE